MQQHPRAIHMNQTTSEPSYSAIHRIPYVYPDQEMDTWRSQSTLWPKDDLSSGSDWMHGERNNYSPESFQDFRWVSDKQACDSDTYLWNFEAE
jgi:predicted NAD/FAD-dependent oxidoreductase